MIHFDTLNKFLISLRLNLADQQFNKVEIRNFIFPAIFSQKFKFLKIRLVISVCLSHFVKNRLR